MKYEPKYKKYSEITIKDMKLLQDIIKTDKDEYEKELEIIRFMYGMKITDFNNLKLSEIQNLSKGISFLKEERKDETNIDIKKLKKININGEYYDVRIDLDKYTISQYVDLQSFLKEKNMVGILTTFIIPKGKNYNEDYDINKLSNDIENYLTYEIAEKLEFFFAITLVRSICNSLEYYQWRMRFPKKNETPEMEKKRKEIINNLQAMKEIFYGW